MGRGQGAGYTAPAALVTWTELSVPEEVETVTAASRPTAVAPAAGDTVTAAANWTCSARKASAWSVATLALAAATCWGLDPLPPLPPPPPCHCR